MLDQSETFLAFAKQWSAAMDAGLLSSADVYRDTLTQKLVHGYTTGKFTTGKAAAAVRVLNPITDRDGIRVVRVQARDYKQFFWEFGAFNAFTRKFERVEYWRQSMEEAGPAMGAAFHQSFTRTLDA